jgi:pimeloyl-ACP methyl ester carboxylesterase
MSEMTTTGPDELRALTRLGFGELGAVAGGIGQIHAAIAGRVFRPLTATLGPIPRLVEAAHGTATAGVYGALRGATTAAGRAAERAVPARRALSATPRGAAALAALNGLIGDELEREGNPLSQPMAVRAGGVAVAPEREALAQAFPTATPRVAVFVHGLMETEFAWHWGGGPTYGARLADELGFTPVYLRYNSGRHVSENGRSLAELLEALVDAWPVEIGRLALVGHSMGGLIARSACYCADLEGAAWVRRVRHVVSLGTPHMGAPLEQAVHMASAALNAVPETRPLARFLRRRSAGIRDLRQGSLVDDDWSECDPDALRARACKEVPLLECATHCFVAACVTRSARHPVGRLVGDTLVLVPSASGRSRTRRIAFRDEDGLHLGGTHHLALLNHPAVYERLREWLAKEPKALPAGG